LLDTNACIQYLRQRNPHLVQRIQGRSPNELRLCSVVVGELFYGAYKSPYQTANLALLATFLPQFSCVPFDESCADVFGRIRAHLEAQGTPIARTTCKSPPSPWQTT
jgi:tRNA(fMet)-specific endonuclease VapC